MHPTSRISGIIALALLALVRATPTPAMSHIWSHSYGSADVQDITAVAIDGSGNVVAAGYFSNTINFGGSGLTSAGGSDIFLVKFNASGARVWDKRFGDAGAVQAATGVAVDAAGNVYLTGYFDGSVNFGGAALATAGNRDVFVAKFDAGGVHQWSKRFGDPLEQSSAGLIVDPFGAYATGYFLGSVNFGGGALTSAGGYDAFLASLDADGVHRWSKKFGDAADQRALDVATDHWGNVFVGVTFAGTVNMGGPNLTSAGSTDIAIGGFGPTGTITWCSRFGDAAAQDVAALATDPFNGYLYFTGGLTGSANFGGGLITSAGGSDVYLAKLDCFGAHLWSDAWGDANNQRGTAVAPDVSGGVFLAGTLEGRMDLGNSMLVSAGNRDVFVSSFSATGAHQQSRRYGDAPQSQEPHALAVDTDYSALVGGSYQGTINFGGGPMAANATDAFLTKLSSTTTGAGETPTPRDVTISAYPNPFNPRTTVSYAVPSRGRSSVVIYDVNGARVTTLFAGERAAGAYEAEWDGRAEDGTPVGSGVYFARIEHHGTTRATKLVLLK